MFTTRSLLLPFVAATLTLTACAGSEAPADSERAGVQLDEDAEVRPAPDTIAVPEAAPETTMAVEAEAPAAESTTTLVAESEATSTAPPAAPVTEPTATTAASSVPEAKPIVASLQTTVVNLDGESIPLVIDLTAADRSNGRVEIKFDVMNASETAAWRIFDDFGARGGENMVVDGVSLIDLVNNQRYLVLIDSEGRCVCSKTGGDELAPGSSISYQASLPAPPVDVAVVDVQLGGVTLITDVPLTDR